VTTEVPESDARFTFAAPFICWTGAGSDLRDAPSVGSRYTPVVCVASSRPASRSVGVGLGPAAGVRLETRSIARFFSRLRRPSFRPAAENRVDVLAASKRVPHSFDGGGSALRDAKGPRFPYFPAIEVASKHTMGVLPR
jgi:hypothetical protein